MHTVYLQIANIVKWNNTSSPHEDILNCKFWWPSWALTLSLLWPSYVVQEHIYVTFSEPGDETFGWSHS